MADISKIKLPNDNNTYNLADLVARGRIWQGTQAQYDALVQAGTIDPDTVYFVTDGTTIACSADEVSYNHTISGLSASDVKGALDELADEKMDKVNPEGTGSFSLNRRGATGADSVSVGHGNTASGAYSFAEGETTTATGEAAHAEGYNNTASGTASHAEGSGNTASGNRAHAEGLSTTASGAYSHAEGNDATAEGNISHAQGMNTKASRRSQFVFGECNLIDKSGADATARGAYVEIVGNGSSGTNRSNARTLDWSGNEVLAGDLTIKGSISVASGMTLRRLMYEATSGNLSQKTFTASTGHFAGSDRNVNTGMYVIQVHGWSTSPKYAIFTAGFSGGRTDNLNISQLLNIGSISAPTVSGGVITFAASTYSKIIVYALD